MIICKFCKEGTMHPHPNLGMSCEEALNGVAELIPIGVKNDKEMF